MTLRALLPMAGFSLFLTGRASAGQCRSMRFPYLFIDLDNTLFDFNAGERISLEYLASRAGFDYASTADAYHRVNTACWEALERKEITLGELQRIRFEKFLALIGCTTVTAREADRIYRSKLDHQGIPFPGAYAVLDSLREAGHKVYVTTNGIAETQRGRFEAGGLYPHVDGVFISEEMGLFKPDPAYYDKVIEETGISDRTQIAVVGDSLTSDVKGGVDSGLYTIWYNREGGEAALSPRPDHVITRLEELVSCT